MIIYPHQLSYPVQYSTTQTKNYKLVMFNLNNLQESISFKDLSLKQLIESLVKGDQAFTCNHEYNFLSVIPHLAHCAIKINCI